jgi:hypothetical protein
VQRFTFHGKDEMLPEFVDKFAKNSQSKIKDGRLFGSIDERIERFRVMPQSAHVVTFVDKHPGTDQFSFLAKIVFTSGNIGKMMREFTQIIVDARFL